MLKRTRISKGMDVGRLAASMARPGIDPRVWVSLAVAVGESMVDADHGVFVDVMLTPSGEKYTARVPADYAGDGFGFYVKIHAEDELVVMVPLGDPAEGVVVVSRLWSGVDKPPQEAVDNPEDIILVIEPEKHLNIITKGAGEVRIVSETKVIVNAPIAEVGSVDDDAGELKVLDGSKSVTIYEALEDFWNNTIKPKFDAFDGHVHGTGVGPSGPPSPLLTIPVLDTAAKSTKVTIPDG